MAETTEIQWADATFNPWRGCTKVSAGCMCMINALTGQQTDIGRPCRDVAHLDWVIAGGESGPKARPMHPSWVLGLRDQCQVAGVPFLFKQWGEWAPCPDEEWHGLGADGKPRQLALSPEGKQTGGFLGDAHAARMEAAGWLPMQKIGKGDAGRLLDGQEYTQFPSPALV